MVVRPRVIYGGFPNIPGVPRDVLVDGVTMLVTRHDGRFADPDGLFHLDVRHLAELSVSVEDAPLDVLSVDGPSPERRTLTAAESPPSVNGRFDGRRDGLALRRTRAVVEGDGLREEIELTNHGPSSRDLTLDVEFDVDFADVFEVRGLHDGVDERDIEATVGDDAATLSYDFETADGSAAELSTTVRFDAEPTALEGSTARFRPSLGPQESATLGVEVVPGRAGAIATASEARTDGSAGGAADLPADSDSGGDDDRRADGDTGSDAAAAGTPTAGGSRVRGGLGGDLVTVETGDPALDRTFEQAARDLRALATETPHGPVPVAGAPWFATVFGRDALLTAYQALPVAPGLATATLRHLAAHRGRETEERREEEPGKVFHEIRRGELAARDLVPHTPYYGSVDATPLWVVLLHETWRWTGDDALVEGLWPALSEALEWVDAATDRIGDDPFLYYRQSDESGLVHKAWRDTAGSVQDAAGRPADAPVASVEVQGYVYDALSRAAGLAREVRGDTDTAAALDARADDLREAFDEAFWSDDRGTYVAARTADGAAVDSVTSNVGHCLWSGIVPESRQGRVVDRLLADDLFSGWGLRTLSAADRGFDPVSYHTGSVWPHDTALVALGAADAGHPDAAERLAEGLLEASTRFPHNRLPELFCGFDDDRAPVPYPAACAPQAWAASAPFALLRACFDLEPDDDGLRVGRTPDHLPAEAVEPVVSTWAGGEGGDGNGNRNGTDGTEAGIGNG